MSGKALEWVWSLELPAVHKSVLYALAGYHSLKHPNPYPSKETLAAKAGVSRATVMRTITQLESDGFITIDGSGGRYSNRYVLNIQPAHCDTVGASQPAQTDTVETPQPAHCEHQPAHSDTSTGSQRDPNKVYNKGINNKDIAQMQKCANAQKRFPDFWAAYPKKRDKVKACQIWKSKKLDIRADRIIADIQSRLAKDKQWQDVQFIPYPTTYLRNERWDDETEQQATPKRKRNKFAC